MTCDPAGTAGLIGALVDFGPQLRAAREAVGLSVAGLARAAGTSRAAVHAYETGSRDPGVATAARLLHCCGRALRVVSAEVADQADPQPGGRPRPAATTIRAVSTPSARVAPGACA